MKKVLMCVLLIGGIGIAGFLPFNGTDVAKLHPVEVLVVNHIDGKYIIKTDTGMVGIGADADAAIEDLKLTAPGDVFLETANYILVGKECAHISVLFYDYLRPACQVYILDGDGELKKIARYLENHPSEATILSCRQGVASPTKLVIDGEVRRVVYQ